MIFEKQIILKKGININLIYVNVNILHQLLITLDIFNLITINLNINYEINKGIYYK
jgi:hypothetical protein